MKTDYLHAHELAADLREELASLERQLENCPAEHVNLAAFIRAQIAQVRAMLNDLA